MKRLLPIIMIGLLSIPLFSQQKTTVIAKGETYLESALPGDMLYAFDGFREAVLKKSDGTENKTRININLFTGDILFLSSGNQILVLAYPEELDRIIIGDEVWLPMEDIFGEVILSGSGVDLVRIKRTRITDTRKESGYGGMSSTTSTRSVTAFRADNQGQVALPLGEYDFETGLTYRLISGSSKYVADARGFKKAFPSKKKQITDYLKKNKVDFRNGDEVMDFTQKCISM